MSQLDVLMVDDSREKIEAVVRLLADVGVSRENVDVALTGNDARERLRTRSYAVLILDLAIPQKAEDRAKPEGGIELLNEIFERGGYQIPRYIVTVTAHDDLVERFREILDDRLIHLVRYDTSTDKWQRQLTAFFNDLSKVASAPVEARFDKDICFVCALRAPELRAVRDLDLAFGAARKLDSSTFFYEGSLLIRDRSRSVIASACPRMGPVAAAIHVARMIDVFRPRILVMTGICAGVKNDTAYGDVIVASPAWDWQSGKRIGSKGRPRSAAFQAQPHQIEADSRITTASELLAEESAAIAQLVGKWRGKKPSNLPRVLTGPVASGASVVADGETLDEIKRSQHRKLLGLDMETYALYAAVHDMSPPRPLVFSAKSVCDHADPKKSDDYQDFASFVSAEVALALLQRLDVSVLTP